MGTALIIGAVLLGVLLLLLVVPVDVAFRFAGVEPFNGEIAIRWLFGLARFRFRVPRERARPGHAPAGRRAQARARSKRRGARPDVLGVLRQAAFRRRVHRLVRDLVAAAHPRQLRLGMRLGLGDPADTGRLWAFVGPLAALAQRLPQAQVTIEPEFVEPVFEFRARGRLLLIPMQFLALAVGFVLSPASLRAWRTLKGRHA